MAIQIGKYKRPGIFIEEFDNSVIATPTVTGITSLVVGFSKKGPVNTPVLLQTVNDLEKIYGPMDRNLERKGSYFHRTVAKMLESSPVYAMNLLSTSDTLDKIEYKSVSTSTDKLNDVEREGAYRRFFDTTGFWKRDTDSFINLSKNDLGEADRLLGFTNMSDRYITVFVFKSKLKGFDTTLLEFYGSADKVPPYLSQYDFASDYMVDIIVVGGDWSNYQQLAVDTKWASYFTSQGLIKEQVYNFANDRNINLLNFYEGLSLIPFFRDSNGRNIFIETIINADTDRTGLFCAFDSDKLEKDFSTGMVDLIGNNLVNNNSLANNGQATIDFLSYNATIIENLTYTATPLDIAGGSDGQNVVALLSSTSSADAMRGTWGGTDRTAFYSEGLINGVNYDSGSESLGSTSSIEIGYTLNEISSSFFGSTASPYAIIGGEEVLVNDGVTGTYTFSIPASLYTVSTATASYTSVVHINSTTGVIEITNGTVKDNKPSIQSSDLVLGYVTLNVKDGAILQSPTASQPTVTNVGVTASGYNELAITNDYTVTEISPGKIKVTFVDTADTDVSSEYEMHRRIRLFNFLVNLLDSSTAFQMTMIKDVTTKEKFSLANATISNIVTSNSANKSFDLDLGLTSTPADILAGNLIFYKLDNEFVLGQTGVTTTQIIGSATASGVVGRYSNFYTNFNNGQINTGDYFYKNLIETKYDKVDSPISVNFHNEGTYSYVYFSSTPSWTPDPSQQITVPDSTLNIGVITFDGDTPYANQLIDPSTGLTYSSGEAYRVLNNLTDEQLTDVYFVYDPTTKVYLQMYFDISSNLKVKFVDDNLSTSIPIDVDLNSTFKVVTNKSNYKQTIEIEVPVGYTPIVNRILVNASRYTEVRVGNFLEAYVDPTVTLNIGEVPRKLTRILTKKTYGPDTSLAEITCDSAINKYEIVNGTQSDYQTLRYTSMDDYVSTYQAISLKGFRVREASMPDGTENRQSSVLNLVAKGTSLFKALTNKEAIDFRYVVDSFGLGLIERSKQQLVDICGDRLDCLGFVNMPSMKSFKNSTSPTFVDSEGVLQTVNIASGGDLESSPAFLYSFGDGRGASCVGYFLPYVTVNDNGRPTDVPPAMYVATTYMRKQNTNVTSIVPWTIAAGVTNGKVTNIAGIEMNFTPEDIENLNGAQMNPIVYKRNRGFIIETENTGQTLYKSALSYLHVREVLIELERELAAMLLEFQWKFNTPEIRAEIKLRADVICEKYVNKNGLYNYFNKCDEENNTPTIIDNQIGVLDTYVEPIKGMGVIVNNITILRTGAIQAGGFMNQ
jgi:hypothetical protein